jgi:hypothetical protein
MGIPRVELHVADVDRVKREAWRAEIQGRFQLARSLYKAAHYLYARMALPVSIQTCEEKIAELTDKLHADRLEHFSQD